MPGVGKPWGDFEMAKMGQEHSTIQANHWILGTHTTLLKKTLPRGDRLRKALSSATPEASRGRGGPSHRSAGAV